MNALPLMVQEASPYERSLAAAMSDDLPIPFRQIMDPMATPEEWLPWLASHRSVDLWYSDWPIERKRQMVAEAIRLAQIKGTRSGLIAFLSYVDAQLVSAVAYPRHFVFGRSAIGIQPIQFPPFLGRYLVKVRLRRHIRSLVLGRSAFGKHALIPVDLDPIERAKLAARVSKAPETQYTATFAHRRRPRFDEMEFGMGFDDFIDRTSL